MSNEMVLISKEELDDLVFYTCRRASKQANDKQFRGLLPFLNSIQRELDEVRRENEYIKTLLQGNDPVENKEKSPVSFIENEGKLAELAKQVDFGKFQEQMKQNQLPLVEAHKPYIPNFSKGDE